MIGDETEEGGEFREVEIAAGLDIVIFGREGLFLDSRSLESSGDGIRDKGGVLIEGWNKSLSRRGREWLYLERSIDDLVEPLEERLDCEEIESSLYDDFLLVPLPACAIKQGSQQGRSCRSTRGFISSGFLQLKQTKHALCHFLFACSIHESCSEIGSLQAGLYVIWLIYSKDQFCYCLTIGPYCTT